MPWSKKKLFDYKKYQWRDGRWSKLTTNDLFSQLETKMANKIVDSTLLLSILTAFSERKWMLSQLKYGMNQDNCVLKKWFNFLDRNWPKIATEGLLSTLLRKIVKRSSQSYILVYNSYCFLKMTGNAKLFNVFNEAR